MSKISHDTTEENIRKIYECQSAELEKAPRIHKVVKCIADFAGTVSFAVCNAAFFAAWIGLNLTVFKFDPYPFVLLMLVVSLEAIFLSTIVLISQNLLMKQSEDRNKLDLQVNLLAEQENTAMIKVMIQIARTVGVPEDQLKELKGMADDTDPEDVLEKISKVEEAKL